MTDLILLLALAAPVAVAVLLVPRALRSAACALAPWAALPAVAAVLLVPPGATVELPWLLLGSRLTLDHTARVFLLFSAALWLLSGVFARTYVQNAGGTRQPRFWLFFLLTMAGSLGVVLAGDVVTFYACFALLGFASYGLIVHEGDAAARRAGRVYISFVVVGELLLFVGIVSLVSLTGSTAFAVLALDDPRATPLRWLVFAGFGIKAGLVPVHMWLPLAHPAAPVPASAVLSGVIIKAGLLGWMRVLPLGVLDMPAMGAACVLLGLLAAFGGVLIGLTQREPKAALAYSSVSQMGIVTVGIGGGLLVPAAWSLLTPAILLYAVHHAFAKAALFLAVGVAAYSPARMRWMVTLAATVPALALAGLPFTSGAAAKLALKQAMYDIPIAMLPTLLSLAAVGTTVLMAHVLLLLRDVSSHHHDETRERGLVVPWALTLAAVGGMVWLLPWQGFRDVAVSSVQLTQAWDALWPPATGAALVWLARRRSRAVGLLAGVRVPPGDLIAIVSRAVPLLVRAGQVWGHTHAAMRGASRRFVESLVPAQMGPAFVRVEKSLGEWATAGALLLAVLLLLASAAMLP